MSVPRVVLTGRAARWIALLHDYGHLDGDATNRLMLGVAELVPAGETQVDLDVVRRAAAMMLFPAGESDLSGTPLGEDWSLLFS